VDGRQVGETKTLLSTDVVVHDCFVLMMINTSTDSNSDSGSKLVV
jgi:hypothetical protein